MPQEYGKRNWENNKSRGKGTTRSQDGCGGWAYDDLDRFYCPKFLQQEPVQEDNSTEEAPDQPGACPAGSPSSADHDPLRGLYLQDDDLDQTSTKIVHNIQGLLYSAAKRFRPP